MSYNNLVNETFEKYNGMINLENAKKEKINPRKLQRMVADGDLERVAEGLYLHPDYLEDIFYTFQYRAPKAIFSHETALYLYNLTDENPVKITATIPSGYNSTMIKDNLYKFYYLKEDLWKLEHKKVRTPYGNYVTCYSKEMTLAQMVSIADLTDKDLVLTSLKEALRYEDLDKKKLLDVSRKLNSYDRVANYLEIL